MTVPAALALSALPANYHAYAQGDGKAVFDAFADLPAVYPAMRAITLAGLPAAFAIIETAETEMRRANPSAAWDDRLKKFLGFCTAKAMALYGHAPMRTKRAIPHPSFTRGEVYVIAEYEPLPRRPERSVESA
jgi:hypothetical protein